MSAAKLSSQDRFDQEYPSTLPGRLRWLEGRLRVGHERMLRLLGLSDAEAAAAREQSWSEIARAHGLLADRAEHLLSLYLSYFDYDTERARQFAEDLVRKVGAGEYRLADDVPVLDAARTPGQREEMLLTVIRQEGPSLLPALALFLASPTVNGRLGSS